MAQPKPMGPTLQGYAQAAFASACVVVLVFVFCVYNYDNNKAETFGLKQSLVMYTAASYGPAVVATIIGLRDFIFGQVTLGTQAKKRPIRITDGASTLYAVGLGGVLAAIGALLLVSKGMDEKKAQWLLGGAGVVWGGSIGAIYRRFIQQYTIPTDPAETATQKAATTKEDGKSAA